MWKAVIILTEACQDVTELKSTLMRHHMTNRECREIQSEDCEKSLSWSFSVERVSEMVIPPVYAFRVPMLYCHLVPGLLKHKLRQMQMTLHPARFLEQNFMLLRIQHLHLIFSTRTQRAWGFIDLIERGPREFLYQTFAIFTRPGNLVVQPSGAFIAALTLVAGSCDRI